MTGGCGQNVGTEGPETIPVIAEERQRRDHIADADKMIGRGTRW